MYEIHPQHNRIYRDIHNVWQWGIVDVDLIAKMNNLGYSLEYFRDCGSFGDLKKFKNKAFIFYK
jgi:hypothetical protein